MDYTECRKLLDKAIREKWHLMYDDKESEMYKTAIRAIEELEAMKKNNDGRTACN